MSLLMFINHPDFVYVLTDTLATKEDGTPYLWVSKCIAIPHLDMVIAGTGAAQLIDRWRARVADSLLCRDIEMLDRFAPTVLRELWQELKDEQEGGFPDQLTATVYHFGLTEETGKYQGRAYRSTSDFVGELLQIGFGIKPVPNELPSPPESLDDWIVLAQAVRSEQDASKADLPRIYIGGDLLLTTLTKGSISSTRIFRFLDHEDQWLKMTAGLHDLPGDLTL